MLFVDTLRNRLMELLNILIIAHDKSRCLFLPWWLKNMFIICMRIPLFSLRRYRPVETIWAVRVGRRGRLFERHPQAGSLPLEQ